MGHEQSSRKNIRVVSEETLISVNNASPVRIQIKNWENGCHFFS
jgi:hypothetical protein